VASSSSTTKDASIEVKKDETEVTVPTAKSSGIVKPAAPINRFRPIKEVLS